ncbi:diguanylate cyclase [Methylomonas sp. SURF-1]|uniref:diguanylate cyclase n=1 Tax=Methylomonas aurea TaxID=2952224 RepID=A0ABT1UDW5_9GAMM|nr:diguanylate cyclase [Methylomonas sp. SURF-1]MCQ8180206.1 diguanylate cyclase [Methylomonas sp. SURF-1]
MELTLFPTVGKIAQREILRATLDTDLREVSELLSRYNVSSVVIEQADGHYVFSVEDLLSYVHDGGQTSAKLSDLPIRKVACIDENEHILAGLDRLEKSGDRYLGVVGSGGELVGILTYTDILSAVDPTVLVQKKTIGELISRTEPVTFSPDWILEDVFSHLRKMEDSIIVVDAEVPVGIVTTKDIFRILSSGSATDLPLAKYMTSPVVTTRTDATINDALMQLKTLKIKRSVVVDENRRLVGVVTQSELVGFAYGTWIDLVKHHSCELKELVGVLESKAQGLEKSAVNDPLTGIGNRRMLQKRLAEEVQRMRRYQSAPFSLLLIDIDHFQRINDSYGHVVGDEVLKRVAATLCSLVRAVDHVTRWGGEEFAVLLPHTPLARASEFAARASRAIENMDLPQQIRATVSIGAGEFAAAETERAFFERVDNALYRAKRNGRNCVVADASPAEA